jgi:hypothetical protein
MREVILYKALIVDQTNVWGNALPQCAPEESPPTSDLPVLSGTITNVRRLYYPADGAQ